ncbi:MAG: organic solvent tolerance protein OstA [Treponema sp.]|nr:organic solvent tolerance protein OstA [Treponema sp.]
MKKLLLCLIGSFFIFSSLFAETISFYADSMSGKAGDSSSETKLIGNAYILTETMEITADLIELTGEDYKNIRAEGNVSGKNIESKMEFKCNELNFDRITKIAKLTGDVNLVDAENEVTAKAQIIEYNQDTDVAVLQIQVNLTQKDNICSSSYAVYLKKDKMLNLSGNAQVKQKSDTFRAQQISLNLDTQEITLAGNVRGSVIDDGSKKSETSEKNAETNPPESPVEDSSNENKEKSENTDLSEQPLLPDAEDTKKKEE